MNCVANGKLLQEKIFENIWIQPASGDAGSALGAALLGWHEYLKKTRTVNRHDSMKGTYLGCSFTNEEIINYLNKVNASFIELEDNELFEKLAENRSYPTIQIKENSVTPIFICGMPRSGTTLCEQILSAHSKVHGAGELRYMMELTNLQDNLL